MLDNRFLTVKETAKYLNIGLNGAYKLCRQADFPVVKIGTKKLVDKQALDDVWIPNKKTTTLH